MTQNRRRDRLTVEKLGVDCLDVRELQRAGILGDTWAALRPSLRWPRIEQMRAARYLIQLELHDQATLQQIGVSWTRCHYGGARPWLHCPSCQRRVAILLRALGGYCCRNCAGNPIYACQGKSTPARRHFEACKLRLRLGGIASLGAPFPKRPRGMHQDTYERLRRRAEGLERELSARTKRKPADYPNLIYYLQSSISK
jgi:hypothetical protein